MTASERNPGNTTDRAYSLFPEPPERRYPVARVISVLKIGGVERQMLQVLPLLARGRFPSCVKLLGREGDLADHYRAAGIDVTVTRFRSRLDPASLRSLARDFRERGVAIVHSHLRESNVSAFVAAKIAGVPITVGSVHNLASLRGRRRILQDRIVSRLRDATVAVSAAVRDDYCRLIGLDPRRVTIIYNGIDPEPFDRLPRKDPATLVSLGVRPADRVVVCLARLHRQKDHATLLRVAVEILRRRDDVRFVLVGDGERRAELEAMTDSLGLSGRVLFAGWRHDTAKILRAADVSILLSFKEGLPNVVLESMAAGLPVIANDVGGNREAIDDGTTGFLLPVGDHIGAANRLGILLSDEGRRAEMGQEARWRVERFQVRETVARTEELYESLLERRGLARPRRRHGDA